MRRQRLFECLRHEHTCDFWVIVGDCPANEAGLCDDGVNNDADCQDSVYSSDPAMWR
jgi:hypothetical protein